MTQEIKETSIQVNFPTGHLGASNRDDLLTLTIRALSLKHGKDGDWADKYGTEYEDDVILIHPDFQDAECTCGQSSEFEKIAVRCKRNCYCRLARRFSDRATKPFRLRINRLIHERGKFPPFDKRTDQIQAKITTESRKERSAQNAALRKLCKEYRIPWNKGFGSLDHCSCGAQETMRKWVSENPHSERCPIELPNFWHKPSGLKVRWYKYIGRDMEFNGEALTSEQWRQIRLLVSEDEIRRVIMKAVEEHAKFAEMISGINTELADVFQ